MHTRPHRAFLDTQVLLAGSLHPDLPPHHPKHTKLGKKKAQSPAPSCDTQQRCTCTCVLEDMSQGWGNLTRSSLPPLPYSRPHCSPGMAGLWAPLPPPALFGVLFWVLPPSCTAKHRIWVPKSLWGQSPAFPRPCSPGPAGARPTRPTHSTFLTRPLVNPSHMGPCPQCCDFNRI